MLLEHRPTLPVRTRLCAVAPIPALTEISGPETLLVVGTQGHAGLMGLLLGSVSRALVKHTRGPLIIVRREGTRHTEAPAHAAATAAPAPGPAPAPGEHSAHGRPDDRVVLLGVAPDPSPAATYFAFDAARHYGTAVHAVRTRTPLPPSPMGPPGQIEMPVLMPAGGGIRGTTPPQQERLSEALAKAAAQDEQLLALSLEPARRRYPDVPVHTTGLEGDPAATLTALAADARLVVLGAPCRHHRGPLSVTPGHVTGKLLAHCPAPVAVVPHTATHPDPRPDPDEGAAPGAEKDLEPAGP
jgi:nucleotide-binding universal stress UspA family protein